MHAIQFGAGNIGRGFIGKILADAGWSVTFADVNETVVGLLARDRRYPVDVVGDGAHRDEVTGVDAVSSTGDAVVALIATTDLVTTAVGPAVLPRLAPTLARGLEARHAAGNTAPLNVIACENKVRATSDLAAAVLPLLSPAVRAFVDANVGFADSAVDRIVPPAPPVEGEPLAVTVEAFSEWIVDRGQLKGWTADVPGMELTDRLMAFVERKLFTLNTGHAVTAYLGFLAGAETIRDAIEMPAIRATVRAAMEESGAVLIRRYGFEPAKHAAYIDKILARFANPHLRDDVTRVGREPLRKLGKGDRLIRPLLGTIDYGLPNGALIEGIAAALAYRNDTDPQAVEMAALLAAGGVAAVLEKTAEAALPVDVIGAVAVAYARIEPAN